MGSWKFGLAVQQPAQIQKAHIEIIASKYVLECCHVYLIHSSLGQLYHSSQLFCRLSPRKIEIIISRGAVVRAGGWKIFEKNLLGHRQGSIAVRAHVSCVEGLWFK